MKYQVAIDESLNGLEITVTELLDQGWECQGGVAISNWSTPDEQRGGSNTYTEYAQAMILRDLVPA